MLPPRVHLVPPIFRQLVDCLRSAILTGISGDAARSYQPRILELANIVVQRLPCEFEVASLQAQAKVFACFVAGSELLDENSLPVRVDA
jgi:hypothetical protein